MLIGSAAGDAHCYTETPQTHFIDPALPLYFSPRPKIPEDGKGCSLLVRLFVNYTILSKVVRICGTAHLTGLQQASFLREVRGKNLTLS